MADAPTIIYTHTDEAPALATCSFLPVIQAMTAGTGIKVETRDISLAGRLLAHFSDQLTPAQRVDDALAELGDMVQEPAANIIKLPNISASIPQLKAAIAELQSQGYGLPDYPDEPDSDESRAIKAIYDSVKGSAINPVLREGNSDRRAPKAVKAYARAHPHRMGAWSDQCQTRVSTMKAGDFRHNEKSVTLTEATVVRIEHVANGETTVLKDDLALEAGEVLDGSYMSIAALRAFLASQVQRARDEGVLFSLHLKATMMKVSDPILFGHAVRVFFQPVFDQFNEVFEQLGVDVNDGLGNLLNRLNELPAEQQAEINSAIDAVYAQGPGLAMVDSDRGITNLHVPSDVIIDASMPAMIRIGGKMWDAAGDTQDTLAVIPDSSYAGVYEAVIEDCLAHGAYDPATMGSVPNVGLMARKAEEYGSHDKTFEVDRAGRIQVVAEDGTVLFSHDVEAGDIWRACQTKDAPIRNWVELACARARATGVPAVFWLDAERPHDRQLIEKIEAHLQTLDTEGLELHILSPMVATRFSVERIRRGEDTISVTGNVLRDYLTDLFPILEVGTSAKMLSIVPLMNGGGLFETGAGGSAPKHVQQFEKENHLRWDSLGEFLALAASLEHLADRHDMPVARVLATALDEATTQYLMNNKAPSRRVGEPDNRATHYWMARYWAEALASQSQDEALSTRFKPLATELADAEDIILSELVDCQGVPQEIGGYYQPDVGKASSAMRPSARFNAVLEGMCAAV